MATPIRESASQERSAGTPAPASSHVRSNGNVTSRGLSAAPGGDGRGPAPANAGPSRGRNTASDFMRIGENRDVHRIPPRERDFMPYDRPGRFWGRDPHYYGYRVSYLPPRYRRVTYWGLDYYLYDGIYYRMFGDVYVVCRPPFGVVIDRAITDLTLATINFAYYTNVYRTFSAIDANNRTIDEQNRIIAQNNATIAAQNNAIALNSTRANDAYQLANGLGLVQSYANANEPYYYQDGVFYRVNANGEYEVIVPPAGALVTELPDDYDVITLGGNQYYKVDDTVYRLTLVSGVPYLEVLGQMYGNLASQYNYYGNATAAVNLY